VSKVLKCGDVHPGCKFEARGNTDEEVLRAASEHAKKEHNLTEVRPEDLEKARKLIREDEGRKAAGA
jgi:predicted small metal-binding protein